MTRLWFRSRRCTLSIRKAIPVFLALLAPSIGFGQATQTGSPITGNVAPITFQSETAAGTNVMVGTISASTTVDDNNNNSGSHPITGTQYVLAPSLAFQQSRSHLKWNLAYRPGLRIYVPSGAQRNQFNQSFGGTLHYDFTKRLAMGLRQDYVRTTDPFQRLGDAPLQPGVGLLNQPGLIALPDTRRT